MKKNEDHHYCGDNSTEFWNRVGGLKGGADHTMMYALGCALQILEEYVLQQLLNAERQELRQTPLRIKSRKSRKAKRTPTT